MDVILHIGMGKTGTSSIQHALFSNPDALRAQNTLYLGMWFDMIDPAFGEIPGQERFYHSSAAEMEGHAERFVAFLDRKQSEEGFDRFILSNEEIYGQIHQIAPFIAALKSRVNLRLVAYARDPREWLPSAYTQWSIFHKNYTGPVRSYGDLAKELVPVYSGFVQWGKLFRDILTIRPFVKSVNVVEDFCAALDLWMDIPAERSLERVDPSEGLLRAVYNTRLFENTLPSQFDTAFHGINLSQSPVIADMVAGSFDYQGTDALVAGFSHIFDYIRDHLGVDLLQGPSPQQKTVDVEDMRHRTLEHLLHIVMHQADQIRKLEQTVLDLQTERHPRERSTD